MDEQSGIWQIESRWRVSWFRTVVIAGLAFFWLGSTVAQSGETGSKADFVGAAKCASCHADEVKGFRTAPHTKIALEHGKSGISCEDCHGAGRAHLEGGGDKAKIFSFNSASAKEASEQCSKCHAEKLKGYEHSAHGAGKVSCIKCHTVHEVGEAKYLLKVDEPKLCYGCHGEVEPEFQKASHHQVGEGKVKCSDCHDLHGLSGGVESKSLKRAANEVQSCLKCHKEQAGPFEFEHAPLKGNGCTVCHFPHGGENAKLLKRTTVNALCLECHAPALNIKGRAVQGHVLNAQSAACTSCHVEIHGSATSEVFFNTQQ